MRNQVTELLTNYGKIDILWFDFSYPPYKNPPEWMQFGGGKAAQLFQQLFRLITPGGYLRCKGFKARIAPERDRLIQTHFFLHRSP